MVTEQLSTSSDQADAGERVRAELPHAIEAAPAERCDVISIYSAKCLTYGCSFEFRGETAELEADQHSRATEHSQIRVHFSGERWFSRPRPAQRLLADRTVDAETIETVRDIYREARELNVLDAVVHDTAGTKSLRVLLADRAKDLEPAAGAIA
jgi:hypothetical protein